MSSGPEHYAQAEECLRLAGHRETMPGSERDFLLRAQAHATLALAAATAMPSLDYRNVSGGYWQSEAWREALGGEA